MDIASGRNTDIDSQDSENVGDRPILTVDVVCFCLIEGRLHVLLAKRTKDPYAEMPALIGGYIHTQEDKDTHAAARRVMKNKARMKIPYFEQLAMFSGPDRDPRGWSATMAYISMVNIDRVPKAVLSEFYPVNKLPKDIAFDHETIIRWAVQRIRNKSNYSTLPILIMPSTFTLLELHQTYEAMMGAQVNKDTFRRKIKELDVLTPTGQMSDPKITNCRPAELYQTSKRSLRLFD